MNEQELSEQVARVSEMGPEDVEHELENLLATIREINSFADVELPDSVKGMKRAGQKNLFEGIDAARFGLIAGYDDDDERRDKQRLVKVRDAVMALTGAEDDLLANEVQSPSDSFLAPYVGMWKTVVWLIDNRKTVWRVAKHVIPRLAEGEKIGVMVTLVMIVAALTVLATASLTMGNFSASAARMIKARGFYEEWLREKALAQNSSTRFKRSRRAR